MTSPRRRGPRTGKRDWLWAAALMAAVLILGGGAVALLSGGSEGEVIASVGGVNCQRNEQFNYHVHSYLTVIVEGQPAEVPASIGIRQDCFFWLHTHTADGLLHIEAPEERAFTLGQFFAVWGEPLSSTQLLDHQVDASHQIQATVNGEQWAGDPADIPLEDQARIVLQFGPPFTTPADPRTQ